MVIKLLDTVLTGRTVRSPRRSPDVTGRAILHSPYSAPVHKIEGSVIFLVIFSDDRSIDGTFGDSIRLFEEIAWLSAGCTIHEVLTADQK